MLNIKYEVGSYLEAYPGCLVKIVHVLAGKEQVVGLEEVKGS